MKYKLLIFSILIFKITNAQTTNNTIFKVQGDLNNDGLFDLVTVKRDLNTAKTPWVLEVKFKQNGGKYLSVLKTETAFTSKNTSQLDACILEEISIKKGILIFRNQLMKGSLVHKFRYQNKRFELIGYTGNHAGAGGIEFTDFNLVTGKKIYKVIDYQTDKVLKETITIDKINPLPNLKSFVPRDLMY